MGAVHDGATDDLLLSGMPLVAPYRPAQLAWSLDMGYFYRHGLPP